MVEWEVVTRDVAKVQATLSRLRRAVKAQDTSHARNLYEKLAVQVGVQSIHFGATVEKQDQGLSIIA